LILAEPFIIWSARSEVSAEMGEVDPVPVCPKMI
jgi:hypothetical protein